MAKPRIVILGGGAGAVTAALQLSKGSWRQHFESITVYQQGWRLGGKGACGRGAQLRIEEHGLHIWFGFYENAFRLLDECHTELDALARGPNPKPRWHLPFKSVEASFTPLVEVAVADHDGCDWSLWLADFFDDDDDRPWLQPDPRPPDERPDEWTVIAYLVHALRLAADLAWSLVHSDAGLQVVAEPAADAREAVADLDDAISVLVAALGGDVRRLLGAAADLLDALAEEAFDQPILLDGLDVVLRALDFVVDHLRSRFDELVRGSDSLRRAYYVVDLMVAMARGAIEDGVVEADDFSVVDDVDLRDWLLAHGATLESVDSALIRALVYDLGFAYEDGDPQRPSCAAGTALRGLMRAFFTYRGSFMWKMNAGMGDVVFLPFYELLVKRGVDVRFFHRVEALRTANGAIEEIEVDVQAHVPANTSAMRYATSTPAGPPPTGGAPAPSLLAWPSSPEEIIDGSTTGSVAGTGGSGERYESWYAARAATQVETKTLRRGPDFDLVVFGLPISCVPNVAPGLVAASPRWKAAVKHVRTVPTQAMQLWLDKGARELGGVDPGTVVSGFVHPFDTWADMAQVVAKEKVAGAATVAYFCSVLVDSPPPERGLARQWLDDQTALVHANALRFLTRDVAALWPGAVNPQSGELVWNRLVAPAGRVGPQRLNEQYLRANVEPSERYVLSVPGSAKYRIPPEDTGFRNLYAVGDWTACGLDAGYVEGAVISGMLAANAIHEGYGDLGEIAPIIGIESP